MLPQRRFYVLGTELLSLVQALDDALDDVLGLVLAPVLDEAVVEMLPGHGPVDLPLLVLVGQFGVIDHAEFAGISALAVDREHPLVGFHHCADPSPGKKRHFTTAACRAWKMTLLPPAAYNLR